MTCNKAKRVISAIVLLVFMVTTLSISVTSAEPQIEGSEESNMSWLSDASEDEETVSQKDVPKQCEDIYGDYIVASSDELT